MQNNTNSSENLGSSAKPVLSPDEYNQPVSRAGPVTAAIDDTRPPILQPALPPSQSHGYVDPRLNTQSHLHIRSAQSGLASEMMHRGASSASEELGRVSTSPTASTMAAQGIIGHEPDDSITDGRKAKRELSQSKRAAQNRAAQRAFRQRKEHYIKKLEQQVRDFAEMEQSYKVIQNDNYALREYVIQLQSRLLDLQVELPQPPPNVNIAPPGQSSATRQPHNGAPVEPTPNTTSAGTLADVAAAVAGLAREPIAEGNYAKSTFKSENGGASHPNDDIRRQLQPDTLPPPSSLRA
ncbi:hypothetical protein O1611_g642 [Lasiodiplodia mahajangana]|uniref:Uncharacterized protein n=1 Tax=Lasiodiplodia mahajangana TaxID=1108764 RepID=A0ACC2JZS6_9PEZI|nr:hypothetical protein O1611_g642 [Lasiodiplodia mahajangana]